MFGICKQSIVTLLMVCASLLVFGQESGITLRIGDPAPPLQYSKWIKGKPVQSFKGDRIYVLEFWATWCGPCRAAMPHLTKLQKEYEGKVSIVGVNIWEDKKKGLPYEPFLSDVERFVNDHNTDMGYSVVVDNNDQFMSTNWMKAAGQEGIPTTFIVKDGKIIWIGAPMALDTTLPKILDGNYNMQAYKEVIEKEGWDSRKLVALWQSTTKPIQEALAAQEYKKALELMETAIAEQPALRYGLKVMKFSTLIKQVSQEEAIAFGEQWQKEEKYAADAILNAVIGEEELSKNTYLWAAKTYEKAGMELNPFTFHRVATVYAKGGDSKNAILFEEKAVRSAEAALRQAKTGAITEEILTEYKGALAQYRDAVGSKSK